MTYIKKRRDNRNYSIQVLFALPARLIVPEALAEDDLFFARQPLQMWMVPEPDPQFKPVTRPFPGDFKPTRQ